MEKVLFVCVENSCRSQMAEGFARQLGAGKVEAFSAGSNPSGKVNPDAIKAMAEIGIDIASNVSKGMDEFKEEGVDYAISMGCKDNCPFVPAERQIEWQIEDPKNKGFDFFRQIRDQIRDEVSKFIDELE